MQFRRRILPLGLLAILAAGGWQITRSLAAEDDSREQFSKELAELRKMQYLIGDWRATSRTSGIRRTGGVEGIRWHWHFKKDEPPALKMEVEDGAFFNSALLRYDAYEEKYLFIGERVLSEAEAKEKKAETETVIYEGVFEPSEQDPLVQVLAMTRRIPGSASQERVTLRLKEEHHYIFQIDTRKARKYPFLPDRIFSVTREGESIAALKEADAGPVCFISGGLGTSSMVYKGKTYYFCCSGCSESFKDDPEKWIAEAAAKAAKGK